VRRCRIRHDDQRHWPPVQRTRQRRSPQNTNASTWASSVSSIQDNPFVEVVSLSGLGGNGAALENYLDKTSVDLSDFQRAVRGNYSMAIALNGDNFSPSDVVAMKIISGGTVRLVVDDTK
jgi:hypothetical protein